MVRDRGARPFVGDQVYLGPDSNEPALVPTREEARWGEGGVWCPRLDQLIAVAGNVTGKAICMMFSGTEGGMAEEARAWASDEDPEQAIVAGSPEEALARWFLEVVANS